MSVYRHTIARAAHLAGGVEALSARLKVPASVIRRWIRGEKRPQPHHFLAAVDIIAAGEGPRKKH